MALEVVQIPVGKSDNFCYLIFCEETLQGVVVDPSFAPQALLDAAAERAVEVTMLLNTHGHRDHIAGNADIIDATGVQLAAHALDVPTADRRLADGDVIKVGNGCIEIMHTPGHSPGSIVLQTGDAVITGDTLFVSRCGRADLPGGDVNQMYESLQRIKRLPGTTRVFPGHDYGPQPVSTISQELEWNEYLQCSDLESFVRLRMG